jgi:integrase
MNNAQLKSLLKKGTVGRTSIGDNLYFRVSKEGTGFFVVRYQLKGKRREISIGRYGDPPEGISLLDAKNKAANVRANVRNSIDPIAEKNRSIQLRSQTVNDVSQVWLKNCIKNTQNPQIQKRVYDNDIAPYIGDISITRVEPIDIVNLLEKINESGRPTIANDALSYCKQLFDQAIKLNVIKYNPAKLFTVKDAGGTEKARQRDLSLSEIKVCLGIMREHTDQFTRDNYIAICLLMTLGVRKGELIAAKWQEFDLTEKTWVLPFQRAKTDKSIVIPIPDKVVPFFEELRVRSLGSEYIFPNRRASKRRGYISDDTLNHALSKLFGVSSSKTKLTNSSENIMTKNGIEHFVIHDLRRTFRTLLSSIGIQPHIAEKCLNHKLKGVLATYDKYDFFEERRSAMNALADKLYPLMISDVD